MSDGTFVIRDESRDCLNTSCLSIAGDISSGRELRWVSVCERHRVLQFYTPNLRDFHAIDVPENQVTSTVTLGFPPLNSVVLYGPLDPVDCFVTATPR
jgi:hypothetical protein